jgi:hypothetical protein
MMYKIKDGHRILCVLQVNTAILDKPGVVIADQNASSKYVRFAAAPDGLQRIDADLVYARNWTHPEDQIQEWRHKAIKCAEVLVPDQVAASYITGIYVSCQEALAALNARHLDVPVSALPDMFFL